MGLTLLIPPTLEPVSLAEAKSHCRISADEQDGILVGYLLAARMHAEQFTRRAFMQQTWQASFDYDWPSVYDREFASARDRIVIPHAPVIGVTAIGYTDTDGTVQTMAPTQYKVSKADTSETYIEPARNVYWPGVAREMGCITVTYAAGYGTNPSDCPEPIRQGILLLVGHWFENREAVNVGNIVSQLPFTTETLWQPYRLFY